MKLLYLSILIFSLISCAQESMSIKTEYPRHIGDIEFDPKTDNPDVELCYPEYVFQYFNSNSQNTLYEGEKIVLEKIFAEQFNPNIAKKESGLIRIRFIVNCKGETDRFRIMGMDENYKEKIFDISITNQLLEITKSLDGWKKKHFRDNKNEPIIDYYQYLIFKIENGQIIKILP